MTPARSRLPNRRPAYTETLEVDGQAFEATVGFDPEGGSPRELFLTAGKVSIALGDDESERRNPCWEIGQE